MSEESWPSNMPLDEVRDTYASSDCHLGDYESAANQFDRWLAQHDREVREAEYARLIELAKTTPLSLEQVVRNVIAENALADKLEQGEP